MAIRESLPITVLALVHILASSMALWLIWVTRYTSMWVLLVAVTNAVVILMWLAILRYTLTKP